MAELRIAFTGASGTGKTTLSKFVEDTFGLPYNPVGSRSVSKAMGFSSPYDVDAAGKRSEFQRRLVEEKRAWENTAPAFVTDRTTLDNLAYTLMHDVTAIDADLYRSVIEGLNRYTHIFHCPVSVFCMPGDDNARVKDMTYHQLYDTVLKAFIEKHRPAKVRLITLWEEGIDRRRQSVERVLSIYNGING